MDDFQLIQRLSVALQQAAGKQDWDKVQQVDHHIAQLLTSLHGQPLSSQKQTALKQLEKLHHAVYQHCKQHSKEIEYKMTEHRHKREGLSAYATFMSDEGK